MTLLGFSLGTAPAQQDTSMVDMSLDDMIASRRQTAKIPKPVSNKDTSIAKSRSKRDAKMAARRGLSESSKPTPMQVEKEVAKQVTKSNKAKQRQNDKKPGGGSDTARLTGSAKALARREKRKAARDAKAAADGKPKQQQQQSKSNVVALPRPPPKKAVQAAVSAMEQKGFKVPQGMQMVISFAPGPKKSGKQGQQGQQNQNQGGSPSKKNNNNNRRGDQGKK